MSDSRFRIVLDTNTLLRGLVASSSAAAKIRRSAEHRLVVPLLSKPVLDEYRRVLSDVALTEKFPELTPELVEITVRRLRFLGDYIRVPKAKFAYPRDPSDAKFIELAIELRATHIISADQDLLSLPMSSTESGRRFRQRRPGLEAISAAEFLNRHALSLGLE